MRILPLVALLALAGCAAEPASEPPTAVPHELTLEASWANTGSLPIEVRVVAAPGEHGLIVEEGRMLGPHESFAWTFHLGSALNHTYRMEWRDFGASAGLGWRWVAGGVAHCDAGEKLVAAAAGGHHDDEPFLVTMDAESDCVPA